MIILTNVGTSYDAIAGSRGLGIQDINFTGVTGLVFRVRYNKVGTGTLSWQLWNETDSTELARIDDSAAGDNKSSAVTVTGLALVGEKTVRVRAKSTVSGDDPVFYGASVLLRP